MATRNQINPPPLRKITDFKSKLTGGGARPNLFEVVLSFPTAAPADNVTLDKARFLVKTAALPASNVSPIDVPFRGRIMKVAGDRTFDTWTVTIINDQDFLICKFHAGTQPDVWSGYFMDVKKSLMFPKPLELSIQLEKTP